MILTGGASVMPFVGEQVRRVFGNHVFGMENGVERKRTREPAFSVGKGLTFMGYVEYLKRSVLEKSLELIRSELANRESMIRSCVTDAYVDVGWERLIEDLRLWKDTLMLGTTFRDGVIGTEFEPPKEIIRQKIQQHLSQEQDAQGLTLKARIEQVIDKTFMELFGTTASYSPVVAIDVVDTAVDHRGDMNHPLHDISYKPSILLGSFAAGKRIDVELSSSERAAYFDVVSGREVQIRSALNSQLWEKTADVTAQLKEGVVEGLRDSLIDYMETITPFFVEKVQSEPMYVGGFL